MNRMDVTDEMLMALADGELDAETAAPLRRRVAEDAELKRRLALFEDSAAALKAAFGPEPVPDSLVQAILAAPVQGDRADGGGNVVQLRRDLRGWPALTAAAAMVALAFGLGGYLMGAMGGETVFSPVEFASLATGKTVPLPGGGTLRMLGSYETGQGLCRMLSVETAGTEARQILCREGAGAGAAWQVALRVEVPSTDGFLPASDVLSSTVDSYLDGIGAGPALDRAAEAAALAGG